MRQWRAANAERRREYRRRYDAANAERIREYQREYYQANRERNRERNRQWRAANPERERANRRRYYETNAERLREQARQKRLNGHKTIRQRRQAEIIAKLLQEQRGRCYLCETNLTPDQAVLEHDHRCCPKNNTWCAYCIRGAACGACNQAIGLMRGDPVLIERIAGNLRVKLAEIDERMAVKPAQDMLPES
jgi:hypothetical protein